MTIESNTFAEACYDTNSIADLKAALLGEACPLDMQAWRITADQWREQIELALAEKLAESDE